MRLLPWGRETARLRAARDLYDAVVAQARHPHFFEALGVPDTLDGRFELLVLHVHLVLRRLRRGTDTLGPEAEATGQALFDLMFADIDQSLREMGVGDLSVGRKVKEMAEGFYGRVAAYDTGLRAEGDPVLAQALARNVFATVPAAGDEGAIPVAAAALAAYVRAEDAALAARPVRDLLAGRVAFGAPDASQRR